MERAVYISNQACIYTYIYNQRLMHSRPNIQALYLCIHNTTGKANESLEREKEKKDLRGSNYRNDLSLGCFSMSSVMTWIIHVQEGGPRCILQGLVLI